MIGSMSLYMDDPKANNRLAMGIIFVFLGMFIFGSLYRYIQSDKQTGFYTVGKVAAFNDSSIVVKSILNDVERSDTFSVAAFSSQVFLHYEDAQRQPTLVIDTIPLDFFRANGEKLMRLEKEHYRIFKSNIR